MSTVVADISMSLDGFVTGPEPNLEHGLGAGGEAIQQWVFNSHHSPKDRRFLESAGASTGAVVMGRRTFDFVDVLRVHLSPVVMGNGTKLFDLVNERILLTQSEVVVTERATHLTYHVKDSP